MSEIPQAVRVDLLEPVRLLHEHLTAPLCEAAFEEVWGVRAPAGLDAGAPGGVLGRGGAPSAAVADPRPRGSDGRVRRVSDLIRRNEGWVGRRCVYAPHAMK